MSDGRLIASFPASGPDARLEYPFDALTVGADCARGFADGDWAPFHLLNAHRKNSRTKSRLYLEGEGLSCALGDDRGLTPRHSLSEAYLHLEHANGLAYAALYDQGVRLAHLTPGGIWLADQGTMGGASGEELYLFSPAYDVARVVPLGRRQRLSALSC